MSQSKSITTTATTKTSITTEVARMNAASAFVQAGFELVILEKEVDLKSSGPRHRYYVGISLSSLICYLAEDHRKMTMQI